MADPRPRLSRRHYVRLDKAGNGGEDALLFSSARRDIRLLGRNVQAFLDRLAPLLDGTRTQTQLLRDLDGTLTSDSVIAALELLAGQGLLDDAALDPPPGTPEASRWSRLEPQRAFIAELSTPAATVAFDARLAAATVAVVGASGAAAHAAIALAAAGIGAIRIADPLPVSPTDTYLAPAYSTASIDSSRPAALAEAIRASAPECQVRSFNGPLDSNGAVAQLIDGAAFVVCCPSDGRSALLYRVNRACMASRIPWTSASVSAFEAILGPTVIPSATPCYLCYKMRAVACDESPERRFVFERFLDERMADDSGRMANTVFAHAAAGHLIALEAWKAITGAAPPSASGAIVTLDFLTLETQRHLVLRKPWCPVCFPPHE